MEPYGADDLVKLAKITAVTELPRLIGCLSEAIAICNMRLLTPAPIPTTEAHQLIDRKEAARLLGVSTFFLETKYIPGAEQRAGRKALYNKAKLLDYIKRGHVPYQDRIQSGGCPLS
jgi:hypothetical protein